MRRSWDTVERGSEGANFGVIQTGKILRRGERDETAGLEKGDALAKEESFANVVGNEDDRFFEAGGEGFEFALKFGAG